MTKTVKQLGALARVLLLQAFQISHFHPSHRQTMQIFKSGVALSFPNQA